MLIFPARSLSVCQGVILLVDANDGVQAQTVANFYLAFGKDLEIIPVLNKIDLKQADPDRVCNQLRTLFDIEPNEVLKVSAKLGIGIKEVIEKIIQQLPHPKVDRKGPLQAFLYDSWYDKYRGALLLVYLNSGSIRIGDTITSHHSKKTYEVKTLAVLTPGEQNVKQLVAGQIGLIGCNMRNIKEAIVGDTFYSSSMPVGPLPGFKPPKPMVFAGIYPSGLSDYGELRKAIEKLILNDSAVSVEMDTSPALGQGFRLGFLGLLHMEVFSQRLEQEHGAEPIITAPSVTYMIKLKPTKETLKNGTDEILINNPALFPDHFKIEETYEPLVLGTIISPDTYLGPIMQLCISRRGVQLKATNIDNERVMLQYSLPLCEIVLDFHDALKSISSGYASFDYEDAGYQLSSLVRMNVLLNNVPCDELSTIVHTSKAQTVGKQMVARLKDLIPRQMIHIAIQATVNGKVVARENIKPFRKDVTAKLYGGDVTRRMKLLAQQAAGKKKMKTIANISVPRHTFIDFLKK
ncbi:translation factor GUF1 homolog, mitochondrial isoform X2 [Coccinella septempunctata]|uniref:translation factor GUF1 homolog, mitochondrial isoform X2 n=1 Tax=Coccinella septempunctata TaxID=41139 RepID=UPI001D0717E4|nr:translation factor GUF1 homolog, mitochondrial isoform X2 [Coccinella septempunctata]